jgi:hypothetical protein
MEALNNILENVRSKLSYLFVTNSANKTEVEGYMIYEDSVNNRTLLLVKNSDKCWQTKWFNNNENTFNIYKAPVHTIFAEQ